MAITHHLDPDWWTGTLTEKNTLGVLNQEILTAKNIQGGMPAVRFRLQRRHATFNARAGGRGYTQLMDHPAPGRALTSNDPHYGVSVTADAGRHTDHLHMPIADLDLDGRFTNDPYPAPGNPHRFHLARMTQVGGRSNRLELGGRPWGNRTLIWTPKPRGWNQDASSQGHAMNAYFASRDAIVRPIIPFPPGIKVMLIASRAALETDASLGPLNPLYVFRAEAQKVDSAGKVSKLRHVQVFPTVVDWDRVEDGSVLERFVPEAWRWRLPAGQNGRGRWKVLPAWESHMDFALERPFDAADIPTVFAEKNQWLLAKLDFDLGTSGIGYHAEALPDWSGPEDHPGLATPWNQPQWVLGNLGGLWDLGDDEAAWRDGSVTMDWAPGARVAGQANDKESIAEDVKVELVTAGVLPPWAPPPYPAPILVTSPGNEPDFVPPTNPPPTVTATISPLTGEVPYQATVTVATTHAVTVELRMYAPDNSGSYLPALDPDGHAVQLFEVGAPGSYRLLVVATGPGGTAEDELLWQAKPPAGQGDLVAYVRELAWRVSVLEVQVEWLMPDEPLPDLPLPPRPTRVTAESRSIYDWAVDDE